LKTKQIYDYLNNFDNIVVCFDNDIHGKKAAEYMTNVFEFGKVKVMKLQAGLKDASDYLMAGKSREFVEAFWRAEKQAPDDIKILSSEEFKQSVLSRDKIVCYDYPYESLNRTTYGARFGELVTLIAETGVGKTQVLRELELHFLDNTDFSIGLLHLEEKAEKSVRGLMSVRLDKRIDLPDSDSTYEEEERAYNSLNDRLTVFDSFGSNDIDTIMDKVRFMVKAVGCKMVFLDHISMIVSDQRFNDERRALDEICTKLKQATIDWDFNLHMVAHVNRQGLIRGTGNIEKLSDIVLRIERDITNENEIKRNTTSILCEKNRYSGDTGPSGWLYYDRETGRLIETGNPDMFEEEEDD
jgi:twinkle protein